MICKFSLEENKSINRIHSYATVSLNNEVYLFGGMAGALGEVGTMAKFTRNREWKLAGRLVETRKGHSGILLSSDKLLVVGGEGLRLVLKSILT